MLNKTEYFAIRAEAILTDTNDHEELAHAYATLALVHAVRELNETLKAKAVVQKKEPGWTA